MKIFTLGIIRKLENQITSGEISISRYIEILNEMASPKWIASETPPNDTTIFYFAQDEGFIFDRPMDYAQIKQGIEQGVFTSYMPIYKPELTKQHGK